MVVHNYLPRMSGKILSISLKLSTTSSGFSRASLVLSDEPVATAMHLVPAFLAVTTSSGESPIITNCSFGMSRLNFALI